MAVRVSSMAELQELCGKRPQLDKLPRGAGRNQSVLHTELVNSCYEWLTLHGIFCWRNPVGMARYGKHKVRYGVPGMPDLAGVMPNSGVLWGAEIKSGKGVQSPAQREMQKRFEKHGCNYWTIRSIDELEMIFRCVK